MTAAPPRPSMSKVRRARLFLAHDDRCGICGEKISGDYEIEHRIAWALAHDDSDENLYPAHPECHSGKTKVDVRSIAKAKRMAGETGQAARREKAGGSRLQGRPFQKGVKRAWGSRPFPKKIK